MKKRVLSLIIALFMVFPFATSSFAINFPIANNTEVDSDIYRIEFSEGIKFGSFMAQRNLQIVAEDLVEVVCTVDAGEDIFTVGYYLGDESFPLTTVAQEIEKAIAQTNSDIATDERLSSNNNLDFSNLELRYVEVRNTERSVSRTVSQLSGVETSRQLSQEAKAEGMCEYDALEHVSLMRNAIDGSYHYIENYGNYTYTYWHNGLTGRDSLCASTISTPHYGDGNNRYESGYQWFPNRVDVNFYTDTDTNENTTKLWYKYDQDTLDNLLVDSNETLEMEVVFYNYKNANNRDERGNAFQLRKSGVVWTTNQPNSYLDTAFGDPETEVSFCVGVDDASDLVANRWYYWSVPGTKGTQANYLNDGRFKVIAQRGYRLLGSGTWSVFSDEHESSLKLGIDPASEYKWIPPEENAWYYASERDDWNFDSAYDPVK